MENATSLKEMIEIQKKYDNENHISYTFEETKLNLIKYLIELQFDINEFRNKEKNVREVMKWTIRLLIKSDDNISPNEINMLENYFIDYKERNGIKSTLNIIYGTLKGYGSYGYLTYDHFKFYLKDLMIFFNSVIEIKKEELFDNFYAITLFSNNLNKL